MQSTVNIGLTVGGNVVVGVGGGVGGGVGAGVVGAGAPGDGDGSEVLGTGPVFFDDFWRERREEEGISPFFASNEKAFQGPAAAAATITEKKKEEKDNLMMNIRLF